MTSVPPPPPPPPGELLAPAAGRRAPLVQCLTNTVVTNVTANVLLALGAAPAMVDIAGEAGPMAARRVRRPGQPRHAGAAPARGDARGGRGGGRRGYAVGARPGRRRHAAGAHRAGARAGRDSARPSSAANPSEILALAGHGPGGRGVDSTADVVRRRGRRPRVAGAPTRQRGDRLRARRHGHRRRPDRPHRATAHALLTRMTGGGCALGAVVAAYAGLGADPFDATVAGGRRRTPWPPSSRGPATRPGRAASPSRSSTALASLEPEAHRHRAADLVTPPAFDPGLMLVTDEAACGARGVVETRRARPSTAACTVGPGAGQGRRRCRDPRAGARGRRPARRRAALLVNDRVDVFLAARALGAPVAGVHVGQRDLPVATVRDDRRPARRRRPDRGHPGRPGRGPGLPPGPSPTSASAPSASTGTKPDAPARARRRRLRRGLRGQRRSRASPSAASAPRTSGRSSRGGRRRGRRGLDDLRRARSAAAATASSSRRRSTVPPVTVTRSRACSAHRRHGPDRRRRHPGRPQEHRRARRLRHGGGHRAGRPEHPRRAQHPPAAAGVPRASSSTRSATTCASTP